MKKDQRALIRRLHDAGYTTKTTKKDHLLVLLNGRVITCFAGTPSDKRSWLNSLAPLRRLGFTA